jgi:C-terminal processing protease CtpA/Prc
MKKGAGMEAMLRGAGRVLMVLAGAAVLTLLTQGDVLCKTPKSERTSRSGWIGVMIENVSKRIARDYKLESEEGAYVSEVVKDSPADSAGIQEGDIIVIFDDRKIDDPGDLAEAVRKTRPGTKVNLTLVREGKKKDLSLVVGKTKRRFESHFFRMPPMPHLRVSVNSQVLGMELLNLNEQLGEYFGAPNNEGVLVEEVKKGSAGEKAGFKAGDVIVRAGKRTVEEVDDITRELRKSDEGDTVEFEVLRKGARKILTAEIEESDGSDWHGSFRGPDLPEIMMRHQFFDDADMQFLPDNLESGAHQLELRKKRFRGAHGLDGEMPACTGNRVF